MIRHTIFQVNRNSNALILFTREPVAGKTKTRLMPDFSPEQCAELHQSMIKDIVKELKKANVDIIVAYTCGDGSGSVKEPAFLRSALDRKTIFIRQRGDDIGSRMLNAIDDVLKLGYEKAILIGTDIPDIESETIDTAIAMLDVCDVVMGPTEDGGYYLIGMKAVHPEAFNVKVYGVSTVFEETVSSLRNAGLTVEKVDAYGDIDTPDDIAEFRRRMRGDIHLRKSHTGRFLAEKARISIIVPVYNEAAVISRMIDQLMPYRNECEIIFVDGGSTDGTLGLIQESAGSVRCDFNGTYSNNGITVLKTAKGRAIQMNAGAKVSTGDILFFLHCDSILPRRFTDEIHRVMIRNDWGCFRTKFPSRNFFMITNRVISNHRALRRKIPFGDQGIFIDGKLFFEIGMFSEIPMMEDYEFSMRMKSLKGIKGPGSTSKFLITSDRRYGIGTISILRTEIQMLKLRHMYRNGVSGERLKSMYDDIR